MDGRSWVSFYDDSPQGQLFRFLSSCSESHLRYKELTWKAHAPCFSPGQYKTVEGEQILNAYFHLSTD